MMIPEIFGSQDCLNSFAVLENRLEQCKNLKDISHLLEEVIDDPALLFPALTHLTEQNPPTLATFADARNILYEIRKGLTFLQHMADMAIDVCPFGLEIQQ